MSCDLAAGFSAACWRNGVGIAATALLLSTLVAQIVKQWTDKTVKGVSRWFFVGQVGASILFIVYSTLLGSILFTVANALVLASALAGEVVMLLNRRGGKSRR